MVNRTAKNRNGAVDKPARQDAVNYISDNYTSSRNKENPRFDDLIVSLANAHENRRARQVTEWEQMRQYHTQPAA